MQRRFDDLRAQILALPVEKDMKGKGEAATDKVIEDVAIRLAPYKQGDAFIVPQEAHFFLAARP